MRTSSVRNFLLILLAMLDTSTRLLRLLTVLQSRRFWTGTALAERLGRITPRTLRRDIDRLRSLGYTVIRSRRAGRRLSIGPGHGAAPLLLDDDEAVAIVVSLRSAVDTFAGMSETAVSALVKLNQLLPARLRKRVSALHAVTVSVAGTTAIVNPITLTTLAAACPGSSANRTLRYQDQRGQSLHSHRRTAAPRAHRESALVPGGLGPQP